MRTSLSGNEPVIEAFIHHLRGVSDEALKPEREHGRPNMNFDLNTIVTVVAITTSLIQILTQLDDFLEKKKHLTEVKEKGKRSVITIKTSSLTTEIDIMDPKAREQIAHLISSQKQLKDSSNKTIEND